MNYRAFGRTGFNVSALGVGCMRLPTSPDTGEIDEKHAIRMIRWAIENGVNYVDTAYGYHGGKSEVLVGKALQDGYRSKTAVATKMPPWNVSTKDDLDRIFEEQRTRLQTDKIDFYLLHALGKGSWQKLQKLDILDWVQKRKAAGDIGHIGFSFHDKLPIFKEIVEAFDWAFCQIQYNYLDEEHQAGTEGLKYAAAKGMGVIVMEPLLGGKLARLPDAVYETLSMEAPGVSAVELALNWLWDKPEVAFLLSGMSTLEQVQQNVALANNAEVGMLGEAGRTIVAHAQGAFNNLTPIPCTDCGYCMPCPQGVAIPHNFSLYNDAEVFGNREGNRKQYANTEVEKRAESCIACHECEQKCPQHIPISEWMPKVHKALG